MSETLTADDVLDAVERAREQLPTPTAWELEVGIADAFGLTAWEFVGLCESSTDACIRIYRAPHELRVEATLAGHSTIGSQLSSRATADQLEDLIRRLCNRDLERTRGVVVVEVSGQRWKLDEFEDE